MAEAADFSWAALLNARKEKRPLIAGIVNATPDSFSDGKGAVESSERVAFALQLLDEGADIIDLGGESTRPGAKEVDPAEEWSRIEPVLKGILDRRPDVVISIDTRHAATAAKALENGAQIINDVSGLEFDSTLPRVIAGFQAGAILTHSTTVPEFMQTPGNYLDYDTVDTVKSSLQNILNNALKSGIRREKIMLDAGIGFGKSRSANYALLRRAGWLEKSFSLPFCWGVSRKSMLKQEPDTLEKRIAGSLAMAIKLAEQDVALLRVHDAAATLAALSAVRELESSGV